MKWFYVVSAQKTVIMRLEFKCAEQEIYNMKPSNDKILNPVEQ